MTNFQEKLRAIVLCLLIITISAITACTETPSITEPSPPPDPELANHEVAFEHSSIHLFAEPGHNPPVETIFTHANHREVPWSISCQSSWLSFEPSAGTVTRSKRKTK